MKAAVRFCFAVLLATLLAGCDRSPAAPTRTPEPPPPPGPGQETIAEVLLMNGEPPRETMFRTSLEPL